MRVRLALPKRTRPAPSKRPALLRRQRGAAIISALLVVTLSALLVAGVLWRQQVQIRRIQNQRLLAQAQWVARGAVDWTRLILRSEADTAPTVTYLGGPAELRYLAFTPPVYERLGVERQRPLPRWSGVLVEPRVDRVLEKFGIDLADLLEPTGSVEARLVRSQLPGEALEALAAIRSAVEENYGTLERTASDIDPTLVRPIQGARHQALAGMPASNRYSPSALSRMIARRSAGSTLLGIAWSGASKSQCG